MARHDPGRLKAKARPGGRGRGLRPRIALAVTNFCIADIGGGLGPYLATWLAAVAGWDPLAIGSLNMATKIVSLVFSTPAGALVDRLGRPRWLLAGACAAILAGTMTVLQLRHFWPILASQLVVFGGGTLGAPAMMALTLGVVGKRAFARQFGWNQAADHAGNMVAAAAILVLSRSLGATAAFLVLAVMSVATVAAAFCIPRRAIDDDRARGRGPAAQDSAREGAPASFRALLGDRRLLLVLAALTLFNLGNDQMLPLLGQRLATDGQGNPTTWMATWILVAQVTMIPMALAGGTFAGHRGALHVLLVSCAVLVLRALLAAATSDAHWVIAVEALDGVGAGLISAAGPIAIADMTYGGGRTQTAVGGAGALGGLAAALSAIVSGAVANWFGWTAALAMMALPPLLALPLLLHMIRTPAPQRRVVPGPPAAP